MSNTHYISSEYLSLEKIDEIISGNFQLALSEHAQQKILKCRNYLDEKLKNSDELFYGINTGFGSFCNVKISAEQIETLQENLVMSHACGVGEEVPKEIVKLMLLLKIQSLSYGHSAIDISTVWRLMDFYNHDITPVIFSQGSLGASGDLAPLAHLSLPLIGMGEVYYQNKKYKSEELFKFFKWQPLKLKSKEGLALLNGTQFMLAYATEIILRAKKLSNASDTISAMSLDAFDCKPEPFNQLIHAVRPHKGQKQTAEKILNLLEGSEIFYSKKEQVQDAYSFRCIPQVHGASKDAIAYCEKVFTTEINSVTDNPNVFPDEDKIISGGNFHGQPLALALDFLAIALSELGNISERRTFQLISGQRNLPAFLAKDGGLNSGFMIPQYTAASIVSQNKQLCTPASVDSIVSSNGQEDHVSMGANAATKCLCVLNNVENILAIELLTSAQALDFKRPKKSSLNIEKIHSDFRKEISFIEKDVVMNTEIEKSKYFLKTLK